MATIEKAWVRPVFGRLRQVSLVMSAVVTLVCATPHLAHSDWQYTRWGMTAQEIVAASGGKARIISGKEQVDHSGNDFTTVAVAEFETGPFRFDVQFRVRKGSRTLDTVQLNLKDPMQYTELSNSLSTRYGKGEVIDDKVITIGKGQLMTTRTRWHSDTDTIILQNIQTLVVGNESFNNVSITYS